jgi:flagellar basal body-associated protein FliL
VDEPFNRLPHFRPTVAEPQASDDSNTIVIAVVVPVGVAAIAGAAPIAGLFDTKKQEEKGSNNDKRTRKQIRTMVHSFL